MFDINERPERAHRGGPQGPHAHRGEPGGFRRGARRRGGPGGMDFGPPFGGRFGGGRGRGRGPEGEGPGDGPFPGPWGAEGAPAEDPRGRRGHGPGRGRGSGPGGPGFGGRGRGRRSRGDVRLAVLALLREESKHGYQIIQEIAERSGGSWKPSPGSVYPTVAQLADEGLVHSEKESGRAVVHLTEEGTRYVTEHADELDAVWSQVEAGADDGFHDLRTAGRGLAGAVAQVAQVGSSAQVTEATKVLDEARRRLYLLLAEVDGASDDSGPDDSGADEDPSDGTT